MFKQGLFWKNLPVGRKRIVDRLGFMEDLSYFKNLDPDETAIIFTGTGTFKIPFKRKIINKLSRKKIVFYLYEPLSLYLHGKGYNKSYYSEFKENIEKSKIRASELDTIKKFADSNNLKVYVKTCDYNVNLLQNSYPNLQLSCFDTFIRHQAPKLNDYGSKNIKKHFLCTNWRYTLHRHLMAAFLTNFNSIISWHYKCKIGNLKKTELFNINSNEKLIKGLHNLNLNKYHIDVDVSLEVNNIDDYMYPTEDDTDLHFAKDAYNESFCIVVNETRFFQPLGNISEKTLKTFEKKSPLVLVAPPNSLEYVKRLGFKTFDRWWDESYDREQNHEKRLQMIFSILEELGEKTIEELNSMYNEMEEILEHNYRVLQTLAKNTDEFS